LEQTSGDRCPICDAKWLALCLRLGTIRGLIDHVKPSVEDHALEADEMAIKRRRCIVVNSDVHRKGTSHGVHHIGAIYEQEPLLFRRSLDVESSVGGSDDAGYQPAERL
jgi:hypothetical protein